MSEVFAAKRSPIDRATDALVSPGLTLFSLPIVGVGLETWICARWVTHSVGPRYNVIPVIPWFPAIPWLAYLFGTIWLACGVGLLSNHRVRIAAPVLVQERHAIRTNGPAFSLLPPCGEASGRWLVLATGAELDYRRLKCDKMPQQTQWPHVLYFCIRKGGAAFAPAMN